MILGIRENFPFENNPLYSILVSLTWPDPLRTGAYQLEIISTTLRYCELYQTLAVRRL